jgi:DNA-binding transcriptional MerR regulator
VAAPLTSYAVSRGDFRYAGAVPPPPYYSSAELERATGFVARTINRYAATGILPPPLPRSRKQRFSHEHYARLVLLGKWAREGKPPTEAGAQLARMSLAEVERAAGLAASAPEKPPDPLRGLAVAERFARLTLLPGLDLLLRDDASEVVKRIAGEIATRYRAT